MSKKESFYSRREFMNCLGISFVSFSGLAKSRLSLLNRQEKEILPPRKSLFYTDPYQKESKVVVVEGRNIHKMMRKGLEALSLSEDFFRDKKIVIKPNTHWSQEYPSTTDPVSVLPVIDFLRDKKSGNITITDGSGKDLPSYRAAFDFIKFEQILAPKGVDIVPINIWKLKEFVFVKSNQWNVFKTVSIHRLIHDAPVLISMTCLKRHAWAYLTSALKNNIGAISSRFRYHIHYRHYEKFKEAVAEVADAVRPDITVIDARDILVKSGPGFSADKSNLKKGINRLLISTDMAALDTFASRLMAEHDDTFQREKFQPTLDQAFRLKLGNIDENLIKVEILRI